ncbi:MAG: tRNA pseudouridine(38-40) synthase TruA [Flavobacteriaceae bacterium]
MRYFVHFSYLGKSFHGWQRQPNAITVQEQMESCFSTVLRQTVELVAAGRTDTGVHASEMYAHFDCDHIDSTDDFVQRINSFLPEDIAINNIIQVNSEAHARFGALERTYEYRIVQKKDPFLADTTYYSRQPYDISKMNTAADLLLGKKDFECFSKSNTDVKTFICNVKQAEWRRQENQLVFTITADRFLRNMVRAVVGTLLDVGLEKKSLEDVNTIIKNKDRRLAGASVPAKGLSLVRVQYPEDMLPRNG